MDWVTTVLAGLAAAGVAGREGANLFRGGGGTAPSLPELPEILSQIQALGSAVEKLNTLVEGLSRDDIREALEQVEGMSKTVEREDRDNPGQKLVWFPGGVRKSLQTLADNVEQQTRILKQTVDIIRAMEGELRSLRTIVELTVKSGS